MMNGTKSSRVTPASGNHAIVQANFGFEWAEPLTPDLLRSFSDLHSELRSKLPRKQEILSAQVTIEASGKEGPPQTMGGNVVAVVMDDPKEDGSKRHELILQSNALIFGHYENYTTWSVARSFAMDILSPILNLITKERPVNVVGLQYVDAFWITEPEFTPEVVFSRGSEMLPSHLFSRRDYWHIHQGFFETYETPYRHRRLTNIDLDYAGANPSDRVNIKGLHRALSDHGECGNIGIDAMFAMQDVLHEENKRMLRSILTTEIQEMIGLIETSELK